jgi:PE family
MSFVFAALDGVTGAAGNLAGIGTALGDATSAAASLTTSIEAAAADDVSIAISQMFGAYGKQFQALSAQAAEFHNTFVSLLNGGAAAYLNADIANAQQSLLNAVNAPGALPSAPSGNGASAPAGNPWQNLLSNTNTNLQSISSALNADPFPVLKQVAANQTGYAQSIGSGLAADLQNFPATLANVPANVALAVQNASAYPGVLQTFINQQNSYSQTINTSLQNLSTDIPKTLPAFFADLDKANQAVATGDYHSAVQYIPRSFVDLFLTGIDISNASEVKVEGPAGDLLPLVSLNAEIEQSFIDLLPQGTLLTHIAQNSVNAANAVTNSLAFAIIGPPIASLDGLASGLTAIDAAVQTGNPSAVAGAFVDMPAYVLDGALNGVTVVQLTIPVSESFDIFQVPPLPPITIAANTPIVINLPFTGLLAPPQPITATIEQPGVGGPAPIDITVPGMQIAGTIPTLLTVIPEQVAAAISPQ